MSGLHIELPPDVLEQIAQRAAEILAERLPAAAPSPPFLTVDEACAVACCSRQRIYDLRSSGRLSRCGDGSRVLVRRDELLAYLEGQP